MSEEKKSNQKARVVVLAALLLVLGSVVAVPTASAATIVTGGCVGTYVANPGGSTWEIFLGKIGRLVDCIA